MRTFDRIRDEEQQRRHLLIVVPLRLFIEQILNVKLFTPSGRKLAQQHVE